MWSVAKIESRLYCCVTKAPLADIQEDDRSSGYRNAFSIPHLMEFENHATGLEGRGMLNHFLPAV